MRKPNWPLPQPQPTTPLRGGLEPFGFDDVRAARRSARNGGRADTRLKRVFKKAKALYGKAIKFGLKPHRNSRGVIWGGRAFYWSDKGYYRGGTGDRRPMQHLIWEARNKRRMAGHEIFLRDRDPHNFTARNMELLTKAQLHKRTIEIGEVRQPTTETRVLGRMRYHLNKSREQVSALLGRFERKQKHECDSTIQFLSESRKRHHGSVPH